MTSESVTQPPIAFTLFDSPPSLPIRDVPFGEPRAQRVNDWGRDETGEQVRMPVEYPFPPAARCTDPETSRDAAVVAARAAHTIEADILAAFADFGWLNGSELAGILHQHRESSVRTALSRLQKAKKLVNTGEKRETDSGCLAILWRLA